MSESSSPGPFRVTHVVFDVDGTLIDFVGALRAALEALASHLTEVTGALVTPLAVQAQREQVAAEPEWKGRAQWDVRLESLRRVLTAGNVTSPEAAERAASTFATARDEALTVYPDVVATLEALRARGFELRAASNGNMDLGVVGLSRYFAAVELAEQLGVSKPDPRFYASVAQRAGVAPTSMLAVGDRVDNDYEPARAAGLHALLIDRRDAIEDGSLPRVRALTEVPSLLELS